MRAAPVSPSAFDSMYMIRDFTASRLPPTGARMCRYRAPAADTRGHADRRDAGRVKGRRRRSESELIAVARHINHELMVMAATAIAVPKDTPAWRGALAARGGPGPDFGFLEAHLVHVRNLFDLLLREPS